MAKEDKGTKSVEVTTLKPGDPGFIKGYHDVAGVELELGRRFFKPRIVGAGAVCHGFLWTCKEFPNFVNEDTGKVMKALIFKLLADCKAAGDDDKLIVVPAGQEIYVPLNYKIEELEQFAYLQDVCHEVIIATGEEVPMKGSKKTMRDFLPPKIVRANVPREQAAQEAAPKAMRELLKNAPLNGGKVAPSLSK